nr:MAG TPA: hypothetical protein [Caudoviricetes sp.]
MEGRKVVISFNVLINNKKSTLTFRPSGGRFGRLPISEGQNRRERKVYNRGNVLI